MLRRLLPRAAALLLATTAGLACAQPAPATATAWSTTWTAPAQPVWDEGFVLPPGLPRELQDTTVRQFLRASVGGDRVRLVVSNEYGTRPLRVARTHVGHEGGPGLPATFGGEAGIVVAPGARATSDPVALVTPAGARLQVDLHLPGRNALAGFHWDARDRTLLLPGDAIGRAAPAEARISTARAFLTAVQVESTREPAVVVTIGDSITDGNGATPGADRRWPDFLAARLAPRGVAVLNAGLSGNRLLRPGMGESTLARFDRDVLAQPGVRAVIVLVGTNDIGWPGGPFAPEEPLPSLDEITAGLRQLADRARARGVRAVAGTLPPFEDALRGTPLEGHSSPAKDALRQAVNGWIRTSGAFDAVVDFDLVLRDEARPARLRPAFDSGDHLHPGDAGYRAMAEAVDLDALLAQPPSVKP